MKLYVFECVNNVSDFAYNKLKELLLKEYNIDNVILEYNSYGKPYLKNGDLYFSISHSKSTVVIVINECEIGVDIEYYDHAKLNLIDSIYNDREIEYINSGEDKNESFIELWTKKESFIKCKGVGIKRNMKDVLEDTKGFSFDIRKFNEYMICICKRDN